MSHSINDEVFKYFTFAHSSVQFSRSVMSDSLRPHESQHARPPCPSPTPGVHLNPSSWWCHPASSPSHLLLLLPPIPPSIRVFSSESALCTLCDLTQPALPALSLPLPYTQFLPRPQRSVAPKHVICFHVSVPSHTCFPIPKVLSLPLLI